MKFIAVDKYFSKKSNASSLYLNIPFINYLAFLFQIRGAYNTVKNYCYINKEIPSLHKTGFISFKYSLHSTFSSWLLYLFILLIGMLVSETGFNPLGKMAAYFVSVVGNTIGGLLPFSVSTFLFANLPTALSQYSFTIKSAAVVLGFLFVTYFIFGMIGSYLAVINVKSDMRRNLQIHIEEQ